MHETVKACFLEKNMENISNISSAENFTQNVKSASDSSLESILLMLLCLHLLFLLASKFMRNVHTFSMATGKVKAAYEGHLVARYHS